MKVKIKRTFALFDRYALHGMGVYHRGFQIAIPQQFLNRSNFIIRLQQVAGETMAKSMR